ncbi:uncharacterized protein LOC143909275 [Arctopsyche grandis]|uniref:uncharacterized protein LOC143909275 n=1 Tax=Arctopsyche grandis TaxID=121162 RepID=UPI00406D7480
MERKRILGNAKCSKTLVRDTEVKIDRSKKVVVKHIEVPDSSKCASKSILKNSGNSESKFSQSQTNSSENTCRQSSGSLDPCNTKMKEATKLTNYHADQSIYKDLIAFNTNNLTIAQKPRSKSSQRKSVSTYKKDAEPKLEDFYEVKPVLDKPIIVNAVKVKMSSTCNYDGGDIYRKVNAWNSRK